ncbi:alpha-ketoacid dehydrogenase subunit beta [Emcibacter sp. SYSU 3D8]|uniref:alpha-ketoacid dehydrogenase subunit beta n=1 Tax=Emcibacter sp. SYSU 3D8 TaxID=3133969 RepID=UPI0031FE7F54
MPIKTYREAINEALRQEMEANDRVIIIGEDVAGGAGGSAGGAEAAGGVMGITAGLATKFGRDRVIDTPITESAIIGMAAGAALTGMRPVAELMFADFIGVCLDQIYNQAAKFRYMFGGKARTPLVVRTMIGAGMGAGPQHSQAIYPMLTMIPGLKVIVPSNAYDAKGLLIQAIRDDDPVIFCEHKSLLGDSCEVPDEPYAIPFGQAAITRKGSDLTLVGISRMVKFCNEVADRLKQDGISIEVIDIRTTSPLDSNTILESVRKTGRLVVVDEANPMCSVASEISSIVASEAFDHLDAPIKKVTAPHTPVPASPTLEALYLPTPDKIEVVIRDLLER